MNRNNFDFKPFFFVVFLILITSLFFKMISGFIFALFWALVFAISFWDLHQKILTKLKKHPSVASCLTVSLIFLCVVIPLTAMTTALVSEGFETIEHLKNGELDLSQPIDIIKEKVPVLERLVAKTGASIADIRESIQASVISFTKKLTGHGLKYTQNALNSVIQFFFMLYVLFYFLRDGKSLVKSIVDTLPLGNKKEKKLMQRFSSVVKATLKGTLLVAVAQGSLGGLMFWALGITGPVLWGCVMIVLSLLPIGGSAIVWGPAAIYLILTGSVLKGVIMFMIGSVAIGLLDNILRPILVGKDAKLPDYIVLLSVFGGIECFGITGFIIGPVIASMFMVSWQIAGNDFGGQEK